MIAPQSGILEVNVEARFLLILRGRDFFFVNKQRGKLMTYVWIGIIVLVIIWHFLSMKGSHSKRLNLVHYIIMLLLEDSVREDHKQKLKNWAIQQETAGTWSELLKSSKYTIEIMADGLAQKGSLLSAGKLLWDVKEAAGKQKMAWYENPICYEDCLKLRGYDVHRLDRDKDRVACESLASLICSGKRHGKPL